MRQIERDLARAFSQVEPMEKEIDAHSAWESSVSSVAVTGLKLLGDDLKYFKERCNYDYYKRS